jgi:hypothetical protein
MLGPVFRFELITTARRKRYYVARFVYGLLLLLSLWAQYGDGGWSGVTTVKVDPEMIDEMSRFARDMFAALARAQGVALIALIPALMAGSIADETERKTLQYLLATPMTSAEIVLGKLAARLLHVGVIVLMGIPVVCLLSLFGGLDPLEVSYIYAGTFSLVLFLSGLSLLISVLTRRPRDAIVVVYVLVFVWLFVPRIIEPLEHYLSWPLEWVAPVNDFVLLTNPAHVWQKMTDHSAQLRMFAARNVGAVWLLGFTANYRDQMLVQFAWMGALQSGLGLVCLLLAINRLRPLRQADAQAPRARAKVRAPLLAPVASALRTVPRRPPCPDIDPMLWKERFATGGGFTWLRSRPVVLFLSVLLACYLFDTSMPAFRALLGLNPRVGAWMDAGLVLNGALRESSTVLFLILLLSVASAAAVTMTAERERDTWSGLSGSLLTGGEIVGAKIKGAVWSSWRLVLALLIMWTVGLLAGALHPLGVLMAVAGLAVFCAFTAAFGVWISSRARSSTRALFTTVFWLLIANGGYLFVIPEPPGRERDLVFAWVMPWVEWLSLLAYRDVSDLWTGGRFQVAGFPSAHGLESLAAYLLSLFVYGFGALILWGATVDRQDTRNRRIVVPDAVEPKHRRAAPAI